MMFNLVSLRTLKALGLGNVARVGVYRLGLKTGLHSSQKVSGATPTGPFFDLAKNLPIKDAQARTDWVENQGTYFGRQVTLKTMPNSSTSTLPDWNVPDWFASADGSRRAISDQPWWKISDFDPNVGDIKSIWELSRFDWVIAFAQRAALGDVAELKRLNFWLSDWAIQNPPYQGVNWKCGQEASIRVMHLVLAAFILGQTGKPTDGLKALVRLHLARIAPSIGYAIGQANNHGTSEAAALFIGGSFLDDEEGHNWSKTGRYWLENRALQLIEEDGTFSQYSVVYHRLMLDTYALVGVWQRHFNLPNFSNNCLRQLAAATNWLAQMTDETTGDVPNMGANDGAQIAALTICDYRDFRPSVQLANALFSGCRAYKHGPWDQQLRWLGVELPDKFCSSLNSKTFDQGGLHVLRQGDAVLYLRYPRFRFRPSQADALHCDLWVRGENILRDAGTYSYNKSAHEMDYFNGTSAHNTVKFDDRDQMPRLGRFLFGDWLKSDYVRPVLQNNGITTAQAAYRDRQRASHKRKVTLSASSVCISDEISGFQSHATLRWRLEPGKWKLHEQSLCNGKVKISISASMPIKKINLSDGFESRYYLKKTHLPVLEIVVDQPGILTTDIAF